MLSKECTVLITNAQALVRLPPLRHGLSSFGSDLLGESDLYRDTTFSKLKELSWKESLKWTKKSQWITLKFLDVFWLLHLKLTPMPRGWSICQLSDSIFDVLLISLSGKILSNSNIITYLTFENRLKLSKPKRVFCDHSVQLLFKFKMSIFRGF